jgi:hypothetical protein
MYISAVFTALNQFKNYGARTQCHKQAEADFSGVEEMIRIELGKNRRDRKIGHDYTEWVAGRFDQVNLTSPDIPGSIEKKYKQFIIGKKIADASDAIDPIDIKGNNDSPVEESSELRHETNVIRNINRNSHINIEIPEKDTNSGLKTDVLDVNRSMHIDTDIINNTIRTTDDGDVIIDFVPKLERSREMYEIQRFLHGTNDE